MMETPVILMIAGLVLAASGIAMALFIGPAISARATANRGKSAPPALWTAIGLIEFIIGMALAAYAWSSI